MGEIADQIIGDMINRSLFTRRRRGTAQTGTGNMMWRMADGRVVAMADMETRHIRNALAMCKRNGNNGKADQLRKELNRRSADPTK